MFATNCSVTEGMQTALATGPMLLVSAGPLQATFVAKLITLEQFKPNSAFKEQGTSIIIHASAIAKAFRTGNKHGAFTFKIETREPDMRPDRELLLEQATACRQLALISTEEDAVRLRKLANDYEATVLIKSEARQRTAQAP